MRAIARSSSVWLADSPCCRENSARPRTEVSGVRLPVLRETRMPAVLCVLGPARAVADDAAAQATVVVEALAGWLAREA